MGLQWCYYVIETCLVVVAVLYLGVRILRVVERDGFKIKVLHVHVSDVPLEEAESKYTGGVPTEEQIRSHIREVNKVASVPPTTRSPFGEKVRTRRD